MFTVRKAAPKDFDAIVRIGKECYDLHHREMPQYFNEEYLLDKTLLQDIYEHDSNRVVFIIEDSGHTVVGFTFICIYHNRSHMEFEDICITEDMRGKNLGWELSKQVFSLIKEECPELKTWGCTIYGFNDICMNLAKKHGYKLIKNNMTFEFNYLTK